MDKIFSYYSFDGDGPRVAIAFLGGGKENTLSFESDGLHDSGECLSWLEGLCTGYQKATNEVAENLGLPTVKYDVEEIFVEGLEDTLKAKKQLGAYGLWSDEMERFLEYEEEEARAKDRKEGERKQRLMDDLGENEHYFYCWGFSGVDHIDESIVKEQEPDFIHKGTLEQAETMAFLQGVEDLQGYRGLHGVPDEEEMDEDEFFEYANDNVVTFVEEKFAFDENNKDKDWTLEI